MVFILQLWGPFQEHLSPHQFKVSTPRGYVAIPFGIQAFLKLYREWVVMQIDVENTFNNNSQTTIWFKLCDVKGPLTSIVPFTMLFYGAHSFLTTKMSNMWRGS